MFGINYHFLLEGKIKFKTITEAILTLSYLVIFLGFGDLPLGQNPKVIQNQIV